MQLQGASVARGSADPNHASGRSSGEPIDLCHARTRRENPEDARRPQSAAGHLHRHRTADGPSQTARSAANACRITRSCARRPTRSRSTPSRISITTWSSSKRNVAAHGGKVVYCQDGDEVADFVLELAKERGARLIVKSKSMTTEEIDFNERLEHHGLEVGGDRSGRVHPPTRARAAVSHRRAGAAHDALRRGRPLHEAAGRGERDGHREADR